MPVAPSTVLNIVGLFSVWFIRSLQVSHIFIYVNKHFIYVNKHLTKNNQEREILCICRYDETGFLVSGVKLQGAILYALRQTIDTICTSLYFLLLCSLKTVHILDVLYKIKYEYCCAGVQAICTCSGALPAWRM